MEMRKEISRSCKECGGLLLGRIDQVYCSDMCRTSANNRRVYEHKKSQPECIAVIQRILLNNYRILNRLRQFGEHFSVLHLQDLGFKFNYLTSVTQENGSFKYHCFNESYILNEEAVILLND